MFVPFLLRWEDGAPHKRKLNTAAFPLCSQEAEIPNLTTGTWEQCLARPEAPAGLLMIFSQCDSVQNIPGRHWLIFKVTTMTTIGINKHVWQN